MITKLEEGKKYKLIDKEGYLANPYNERFYKEYFTNDVVKVFALGRDGSGYLEQERTAVITLNEYKYFELYEEPSEECICGGTPHYWDGKEELQVGMMIAPFYHREEAWKVEFIKGPFIAASGPNKEFATMGRALAFPQVKREPTLEEKQEELITRYRCPITGDIRKKAIREFAEKWKEL